MKFYITHDYMKAMYNIRLDINIDGLDVYATQAVTEETVQDGGDAFLEWQACHMMLEAMKMASEAYMPGAIKQMKEEFAATHGIWNKPPALPDGMSIKYGDALITSDEDEVITWDSDNFMWSPYDGNYVTSILKEYVDLKQRVNLPRQALEDMGIDNPDHPTYRSVTLEAAIIYLNDDAKWSYDQIADWLETLDVDIALNLEGGE